MVSRPRVYLIGLLLLSTFSLFPTAQPLPSDGARVDLCGPRQATVGVPVGFIGRLTVSDQTPTALSPFMLKYSVYVEVEDGTSGWVQTRPDGWFQFALMPEEVETMRVSASLGPGLSATGTTWAFPVTEGAAPSGVTVEVNCYLAYRDVSHAELYLVVGGALGADVVHEEIAPVGGSVQIDAGQSCWTSVPFCDWIIDHQSAGFSMLIAPNAWWETDTRPWAAWAGPFHYWAGAPVFAGCAPTLWIDIDAYTTTADGTFHDDLSLVERHACEAGAVPPGPE